MSKPSTVSKDNRLACAESLLHLLSVEGYLDSTVLDELRLDDEPIDAAALAGYLAAIDADGRRLLEVLGRPKALAAITASRRKLADDLIAAVASEEPFSLEVRHAFGILGPHHDRALRSAVRLNRFGHEDAVRAAFDGAALRRLLSGFAIEINPVFDSTIGIGSRQSIPDTDGVRFESPMEVGTPNTRFRLLVSNAVELWRATATPQVEPETTAWLDTTMTRDSTLYDIGANIGYFSLYAWSLGAANVVAFEPAPLNFARLNENLLLNNASSVLALPVALSDASRITRLGYRDFVRGASSPQGVDAPPGANGVGCVCMCLDTLRGDQLVPRPTHIKLDVDGHEHSVLTGAEETLAEKQLAHLLIEIQLKNANEVLGQLARLGFRNTAAYPREGGIANYVFERW